MNPIRLTPITRANADTTIHVVIRYLHMAPLFLIAAAVAVLFIGVFCVEILLTSWPSIPEPIEHSEQPQQQPTSTLPLQTVALVQIYPQPQDMTFLGQTLKQDVIRHGGTVIRGNDEARNWTFAVSEDYLTRIQPLISASGVRPPGTSYREWARMVSANPKDSNITGPAYAAVTFHFKRPWFSRPATMWAAFAAGIMAGCAILIMPAALILHKSFPHRAS